MKDEERFDFIGRRVGEGRKGTMSTYVFDNAWEQARQRLALLEQCLDPVTCRRIKALGIANGWQCLEAGAGGGSIAQWLCSRVGVTGRVVAIDIDTRFLDALHQTNLEVRRHNLISDQLPENSFDLVHTRLVLMHIPSRHEILRRLVSALKPGGWLLLEEQDVYPVLATASGSYRQVWTAFMQGMARQGVAPEWARDLPQLLGEQRLHEVGAEGDIPIFSGASLMAQFWSLTWKQVRAQIQAVLNEDEILDDALRTLGDATKWFAGPANIAAWGRRPAKSKDEG